MWGNCCMGRNGICMWDGGDWEWGSLKTRCGIVVSDQRGMRGLGGLMRDGCIGICRGNGDKVGLGGYCCLGENARGLVLGGDWSLYIGWEHQGLWNEGVWRQWGCVAWE